MSCEKKVDGKKEDLESEVDDHEAYVSTSK